MGASNKSTQQGTNDHIRVDHANADEEISNTKPLSGGFIHHIRQQGTRGPALRIKLPKAISLGQRAESSSMTKTGLFGEAYSGGVPSVAAAVMRWPCYDVAATLVQLYRLITQSMSAI